MELFEAIAAGDVEVARRLLTADPALARVRHPSGPTPVLYALYHREAGLARELAGLAGPLDLPEAAALDEVGRVTEVLDAGGAVDARTPDGFTPLHLAAFFGAPAVAALLIARGADVAAVADNPMRIQALHAAASGGHVEIATALLAAGADPARAKDDGVRPAELAREHGHPELADELGA